MHFSECSGKFYDRKFRNFFVGARTVSRVLSPSNTFLKYFQFDDLIIKQTQNVPTMFFDPNRRISIWIAKINPNFSVHRFLESMKLPTSTKPTSGFHICDILELNKEKQQKKQRDSKDEDEKIDDDDEIEMKKENLSCESDELRSENSTKRKHSPSPTSPITRESQSPQESPDNVKDLKKLKKHSQNENNNRPSFDASSGHQQLLNETMHQYPHLFQNHPAMRPWFNSNGEFKNQMQSSFASLIKMEHEALKSGSDFREPFWQISRFNWAHQHGDDDVCCTIFHSLAISMLSLAADGCMPFHSLYWLNILLVLDVGLNTFQLLMAHPWNGNMKSIPNTNFCSILPIVPLCGKVSLYIAFNLLMSINCSVLLPIIVHQMNGTSASTALFWRC